MDRPSTSPGGQVVATGRGCDPGAPVTLFIGDRPVGSAVADQGGQFSAPLRVPGLDVGRYDVTARCGPTLITSIDLIVASRVEQGMSAAIVLVLFVLIAAVYLVNQLGKGRAR